MATMKQKPKQTATEKKNLEDASKNKNMRLPFKKDEKAPKSAILPKRTYVGGSSAKNGTSLGMKSVKAGFDKNPGVTRADIITAAKGKAQYGKKMKKINKLVPSTSQIKANVMPPKPPKPPKKKMGGSMKKCKYGCK